MTDTAKAEVIIDQVCDYFKVNKQDIMTPCRKREVVEPRYFAMYYIRKFTKLSHASAGAIFRRDHSTVIHACNLVDSLIKFNGYAISSVKMETRIESALHKADKEYNMDYYTCVAQL